MSKTEDKWKRAEILTDEFVSRLAELGIVVTLQITDTETGAYVIAANECIRCAVENIVKWMDEHDIKHVNDRDHITPKALVN